MNTVTVLCIVYIIYIPLPPQKNKNTKAHSIIYIMKLEMMTLVLDKNNQKKVMTRK